MRASPSGPTTVVPVPVGRHPSHHDLTRSIGSTGSGCILPTAGSPVPTSEREPKPRTTAETMRAMPPGPNSIDQSLWRRS